MREIILITLWTVFWLVIESTLLNGFPSQSVRCDFIFLSVVALGFTCDWREGFVPVVIIGIIADGISPAPFGIFIFLYLTAFAILRFAGALIYVHSFVGRFTWISIASAAILTIEGLLLMTIYGESYYMSYAMWRLLPQTLWNGLTGLFMVPFFGWYMELGWKKFFTPKGLVLR